MARIVVTSQAELDALPMSFKEYTVIEIRSSADTRVIVKVTRESSHVEAWGSSHVEAWGSSHVEARGSSHVVARGSSHVEAWGSVAVHVHSELSTITLFAFAAAWLIAKAKVVRKSKTCTVITPKKPSTTKAWTEEEGVEIKVKFAIVYKRVSKDWKTQEGTRNETAWPVGADMKHPAYEPKTQECGAGKFHACSKPYFCDEFRSTKGDRYIAIKVPVASLHYWGTNASYPHKVAFGEGKVMYECDRFGKKVGA